MKTGQTEESSGVLVQTKHGDKFVTDEISLWLNVGEVNVTSMFSVSPPSSIIKKWVRRKSKYIHVIMTCSLNTRLSQTSQGLNLQVFLHWSPKCHLLCVFAFRAWKLITVFFPLLVSVCEASKPPLFLRAEIKESDSLSLRTSPLRETFNQAIITHS